MNKTTTEDYVKKANLKHDYKYDYSLVVYKSEHDYIKVICPIHGCFEQKARTHLHRKQACDKCIDKNPYKGQTKELGEKFIEKSKLLHNKKYDYSLVSYINTYTKVEIICPIHGIFKQKPNIHLEGKGCPMCKESKGEREVRMFLEKNNIKFIPEFRFNDCKNVYTLPFDFYLPDLNTCIEYHGKQHYEPIIGLGGNDRFIKQKERDNIKEIYCINNNIELIIIPYNGNVINELIHLIN